MRTKSKAWRQLVARIFVTSRSEVPTPSEPEVLINLPNFITVARTIACAMLFTFSLQRHSELLMWAGLAAYWTFDVLDGITARLLDQETRAGALLDSQADRVAIILFLFSFVELHRALLIPATVYIVDLLILQSMLYDQYLRFDILSPNYFYQVDRVVWLLNWSPPAKIFSTGIIIAVIAFIRSPSLALALLAISFVMRAPALYMILHVSSTSSTIGSS